jgi:hypothetical protein
MSICCCCCCGSVRCCDDGWCDSFVEKDGPSASTSRCTTRVMNAMIMKRCGVWSWIRHETIARIAGIVEG